MNTIKLARTQSIRSLLNAAFVVIVTALCVVVLATASMVASAYTHAVLAGSGVSHTDPLCLAWADEVYDGNAINPQQVPDSSFIYDTSISDLQNADSYMDGQTVQVIGEVVGDRILAGGTPPMCWITLEAVDGSFAEVSTFMTCTMTDAIDTYGAYGRKGTTLQVRGTFNLVCAEHEGLTDLHVEYVSVVSKGAVHKTQFEFAKFWPGIILLVFGFGLIVLFKHIRESRL